MSFGKLNNFGMVLGNMFFLDQKGVKPPDGYQVSGTGTCSQPLISEMNEVAENDFGIGFVNLTDTVLF